MAKSCPRCKFGVVTLAPVMVAKPTGTYSIAGAQTKVAAKQMWIVTCSNCDLNVRGRLKDATLGPNGAFTGGYFVEERE